MRSLLRFMHSQRHLYRRMEAIDHRVVEQARRLVTLVAKRLGIIATALALAISTGAHALDLASLPDFRKYTVGPYLTAAAGLQEMGREAACQALLQAAQKAAQTRSEDIQVIVLCRMLFTKRDDAAFRRPLIGAATFMGDTDYPDWKLEPIEMMDGVPFLITRGYALAGLAESTEAYVRHCMANCDWNAVRFRELTANEKKAALAKLLASKTWKRPLETYEQVFLSAQIE